jgi:hypothetical protein
MHGSEGGGEETTVARSLSRSRRDAAGERFATKRNIDGRLEAAAVPPVLDALGVVVPRLPAEDRVVLRWGRSPQRVRGFRGPR